MGASETTHHVAPWRGVQNDPETVAKNDKKESKISVLEPKIEVLEGLEPPWATIWGPRGGRFAFVTFLSGF